MKNVRFPDVPNVVHDVGSRQGYVGISVLYGQAEVPDGSMRLTASILYRPDADELRALNQGGKIKLTMFVPHDGLTPHRLDVVE